ncbi:cohesin domain-containing protein [Piscinibacter defluvii]|uniref:cohesin domain-containing protein n=1 Tax=Piscinibacter defluvii TaxID=1796922 RepID=UPI000FDDE2C2|nr:cohesin domain-containing protein [Piscinibacter defluvii]
MKPLIITGRGVRLARLLLATSVLLLAAGCAQQRIRDEAQQALRSGEYEQAVRTLEGGLKDHPDSALLRSGLIQARGEALGRLVAEAAAARAAGRYDEARALLDRARNLDPRNARVGAQLADLATEQRQQAALAEAEALLAKGRAEPALRAIEAALKDNPRHAGLLALQRRIEIELRQTRVRAAQAALAETRPISLDFRDASLRTVLDVVSRNSGINFVLDRDIRAEARITVFLRQTRVEDALELITSTNQLAKKVLDPQTILIYPNTPEKQREHQEQVVRVFYLASAEAKGAAAFLRAMLKIREPFVDERSNMLSLRDTAENIQLAERLIALYDAGEPEVLLEVEVLEISSTRLTELGIKYPDSFSLTPLAPDGGDDLTLGNIRGLNRDRLALGIGGLLVNLKRQVGDFTTLANPRIRARNKEKAKILIGDKIPVITTTTGTGNFVSESVSYLDVGLKLDVEPTVYADDEVAIRIALEVSALGSAVKTSTGSIAYQIGTRNANTMLRLRDGETQLLAGLISRDDRSSASRVPGIGDLPVLGRLFSSQLDNGQRTELVLAITPRVLRNIRRPDANETELWVGTDAQPRLRLPVLAKAAEAAPVAAAPAASAAARAGEERREPTPAPATLAFRWLGPAEVKIGDTVELKLDLNTVASLRGMPLTIGYDRARLEWQDAAEGEFFRRDGATTSFSHNVESAAGRARIGVLRNQATGASGQGTLLTLKFRALAAGPAEVRLDQAQPIGLGAVTPSPAPTAPWTVQVR